MFRQLDILIDRYLTIIYSDYWNLLLLVVQVPIIAGLIVMIFDHNDTVTDSIFFSITVSSIWFGLINSCREIVKERDSLEREKRYDLNLTAYYLSKLAVLGVLGGIQAFFLLLITDYYLHLPGNFIIQFFGLWATTIAATCLGLMISAFVSTSDQALMVLPIFLIPQLLLSDLLMPLDQASDWILRVNYFVSSNWGYQIFESMLNGQIEWGSIFESFGVLFLQSFIFSLLARIRL